MTMTVAPESEELVEAPVASEQPRVVVRNNLPAVEAPSARAVSLMALAWSIAAVASIAAVLYGLTPIFQQRDQSRLFDAVRSQIQISANESLTIEGATVPTKAPRLGAGVGILEIGGLQIQQVAVEGVDPSQTAAGPGHVPGTSGLGQPGNSVVVGRRSVYGGPFSGLAEIHQGDSILVTTRQGQTVYVVDSVGDHTIDDGLPVADTNQYANTSAPVDKLANDRMFADDLYKQSGDNRLTLLTSASTAPWNQTSATVVVAKMKGPAFPSTIQGSRFDDQTGRGGDAAAWPSMLLALIFLDLAVVAAMLLYRRSKPRTAYLLSAAPLLVGVILVAESLTRLLPAWY